MKDIITKINESSVKNTHDDIIKAAKLNNNVEYQDIFTTGVDIIVHALQYLADNQDKYDSEKISGTNIADGESYIITMIKDSINYGIKLCKNPQINYKL